MRFVAFKGFWLLTVKSTSKKLNMPMLCKTSSHDLRTTTTQTQYNLGWRNYPKFSCRNNTSCQLVLVSPRDSYTKLPTTHLPSFLNKNPIWKVLWNISCKLKLRLTILLVSQSISWALSLKLCPPTRRWWRTRLHRLCNKWSISVDPKDICQVNLRPILSARWMLLLYGVRQNWTVPK